MLIIYLALGFCCGVIAATAALWSGAGILAAFAAYTIGGMTGVVLSIFWAALPQRANAAKHGATQRS